ncbi:MAG: helix-turn-helix domain-containing protein [Candidatus Cybelea sp.]
MQALRERESSVTSRDVLVVLAGHASKTTRTCWPTIETIAHTLQISTRAVIGAVGELKDAGIVDVTVRNRRKGESNLYELAFDGPFQVNAGFIQSEAQSGEDTVHISESGEDGVHLKGAEFPRSCEVNDRDHVKLEAENQFPDSCSNGAEEPTIEPTSEPSVLTTFVPADSLRSRPDRERQKKDGMERDRRDLQRIVDALTPFALNGRIESQARLLLNCFDSEFQRDSLIRGLAEVSVDPSFVDKTITEEIAHACNSVPF